MKDIRRITHQEFCDLKTGNIVFVKCGKEFYKSKVVEKPFYNVDADEPDWEIETDNGFCDEYSLYLQIKG